MNPDNPWHWLAVGIAIVIGITAFPVALHFLTIWFGYWL
jgi:hypothetical protein